jgi:hypothetical protein
MFTYQLHDTPTPQRGKTSPIQKGLIPTLKGEFDIAGEGLGFGVPILQYPRDFYFPGTTQNQSNSTNQWEKTFKFDLIERHHLRKPQNVPRTSWISSRLVNSVYKTTVGRNFLKIGERIYNSVTKIRRGKKNKPFFLQVQDRGTVRVRFHIDRTTREVDADLDFTHISRQNLQHIYVSISRQNLQHIYVSNELNGRLYTQYFDSEKKSLLGDSIEPWARIHGNWAVFHSPLLKHGFRITIPQNTRAFRGREVFSTGEIFWSGIILRLPNTITQFRYKIQFGKLSEIINQEDFG